MLNKLSALFCTVAIGHSVVAPTLADIEPFSVDFTQSVLPEYSEYKNNPVSLAKTALMYFINQQSEHKNICLLSDEIEEFGKEGSDFSLSYLVDANDKTSLKLNACLTESNFKKIYVDENPFSCSGFKRKPSQRLRLDWLVHQLLNNYSQLTRVPKNQEEVESRYNVDLRLDNVDHPRKVIDNSFVTRDKRVIGALRTKDKKVMAIATWDFNKDKAREEQSFFEINPKNPKVDALEIFFKKPNGLRDFMLFDVAANAKLEAAPGGVADFSAGVVMATAPENSPSILAHGRSNAVRNGVDCMICHSGGTLSMGMSSINKEIIHTATLGGLPKAEESLLRELYNVPEGKELDEQYDDSEEVEAILAEEEESFRSALKSMYVRDFNRPILPDIEALYTGQLTISDAAREHSLKPQELQKLLNRHLPLRRFFGISASEKLPSLERKLIPREVFNSSFCKVQFLIGQAASTVLTRLKVIENALATQVPSESSWIERTQALEKTLGISGAQSRRLEERLFNLELALIQR